MKILYGVQATGNGHITRARAMAAAFKKVGMSVDFVFSGRPESELFDMEVFGSYRVFRGITFVFKRGTVNYWATYRHAKLTTLWRDVRQLDVSMYDLVITDFEPITAWAARRAGKPCIGVGHQYAFPFNIPKDQDHFFARLVMNWFAPASVSLGAHWHHFNQPILPPLIETHFDSVLPPLVEAKQVVVYLPFEDVDDVVSWLAPLTDYRFEVFTPMPFGETPGHIRCYPLGRASFQQALACSASVLCNAGFELTSEALHLGRRIMVKPTHGQMEQASNAKALAMLGYGWSAAQLNAQGIQKWLETAPVVQVRYPDVAAQLVDWILARQWDDTEQLIEDLWAQVEAP